MKMKIFPQKPAKELNQDPVPQRKALGYVENAFVWRGFPYGNHSFHLRGSNIPTTVVTVDHVVLNCPAAALYSLRPGGPSQRPQDYISEMVSFEDEYPQVGKKKTWVGFYLRPASTEKRS